MKFRGEYFFLSNFYPCEIIAWGIEFPTSEHIYVAAKALDTNLRKQIAKISTPGQAKRFGRNVEIQPDWDEIKVSIMRGILCRKFSQNPDLRIRLAEIKGVIIEHNLWHDNFWGICRCRKCSGGENTLGKLLMSLEGDLP